MLKLNRFFLALMLLLAGCTISKVETHKIKVKVISPTGDIIQTKTVYGSHNPRVRSYNNSKSYVFVDSKEVLYLPDGWTYDWEILDE